MSDTPLDLCAAQKLAEAVGPGYGDYSRLAQETLALLAHCRALRAALRDVIPSDVARKVMAEYGDAGSLMNDVVTSYERAATVLASAVDGEAAP